MLIKGLGSLAASQLGYECCRLTTRPMMTVMDGLNPFLIICDYKPIRFTVVQSGMSNVVAVKTPHTHTHAYSPVVVQLFYQMLVQIHGESYVV